MQVMKWSVIALAVAAGTSQMAVASSQSESNGFIEDSSFNIFNRVLYMNRDFRNGQTAQAPPPTRLATQKKPAWASACCTNLALPKAP